MLNNFKARLQARETLIGSLVTLGAADVAEVMSLVGFDYLWIDAEHSSMSFAQTQGMIQAVSGRCPCLVRVPENKEVWIKKALDTGCAGIIVPQVKTAEQAQDAVRWSLYPPEGERSVGISRAHGYGMSFGEYVSRANEELVIVIQIEHEQGVKNIESIVQVPGIGAILIGPYDLSGSLGVLGEVGHAEVKKAIRTVRKQCQAAGVPVGIFASVGQLARAYIDEGFSLIALGMDTFFLWGAAREELGQARGDDA